MGPVSVGLCGSVPAIGRRSLHEAPKQILVVDDDIDICTLVEEILTADGYAVSVCCFPEQALKRLWARQFDLVITDIRMPRLSGIDLLELVRSTAPSTKVIVMTGFASVQTAVAALRGRAADYLVKPFAAHELRKRVQLALQYTATDEDHSKKERLGAISIDLAARRAWVNDQEVKLTRIEFDLIACLAKGRGGVVTYEELVDSVWKQMQSEDIDINTLKAAVYRLRKKIQTDPGDPQLIRNARGVGYQLAE